MPDKDEVNVQKEAAQFMPPWAWAVCAIIMFTSFALRQAGIDISTPLNTYFMAKADLVKAEAGIKSAPAKVAPPKAPTKPVQPVPQVLKVIVPPIKEYDHSDLQQRLRGLESDSHALDKRVQSLEEDEGEERLAEQLESHKHSIFKRKR